MAHLQGQLQSKEGDSAVEEAKGLLEQRLHKQHLAKVVEAKVMQKAMEVTKRDNIPY